MTSSGRSRRGTRTAVRDAVALAAASLLLAGPVLAAPRAKTEDPYRWAKALPGCGAARPAVAHRSDGRVLPQQPADGPVVCGGPTGWPTVENRIEVTNTGAVIYQPALGGGPVASGDGRGFGLQEQARFGRSVDGGRTWSTSSVKIFPETYVGNAQVDNNLYVDHQTGRLFWYIYSSRPVGAPPACSAGAGGTVVFSDDSGSTWSWGFDLDHECSENPTIVTARPRDAARQQSYPEVTYLCGDNTRSGVGAMGTLGWSCSKSFDGGAAWSGTTSGGQGFYSGIWKDTFDPYPQCGGESTSATAGVQPLPDGSLLVPVVCADRVYLGESRDEGATWHLTHRLPSYGRLRADSAGNLFVVTAGTGRTGNSTLLLSHSTDRGRTWSAPVNLVARGVRSVSTWMFAQGTHAPGHVGDVAIAYYGTRGQRTASDGFITATRDALAPDPVFWSGQVNSASRPLVYNTRLSGNIGTTIMDFNGGAWAPGADSVWGSWVQDCGADATSDPNCRNRLPGRAVTSTEDGYAGRLAWRTKDTSS
jgi:hypothetical protein